MELNFENISKIISTELTERWFEKDINETINEMKKSLIIVLWWDNSMVFFEDWKVLFHEKCVTWVNGFSCEEWNKETPIWLHKISDFIGEWSKLNMEFISRKPVEVIKKPKKWILKPWMYGRILQLDWLESINTIQLIDIFIFMEI